VRLSVRRINVAMSSAFPYQADHISHSSTCPAAFWAPDITSRARAASHSSVAKNPAILTKVLANALIPRPHRVLLLVQPPSTPCEIATLVVNPVSVVHQDRRVLEGEAGDGARLGGMKLHKNAKLTPAGRAELVCRVLELHQPAGVVAQAMGVSTRSAFKWLARFRAEGLAGLADRFLAGPVSAIRHAGGGGRRDSPAAAPALDRPADRPRDWPQPGDGRQASQAARHRPTRRLGAERAGGALPTPGAGRSSTSMSEARPDRANRPPHHRRPARQRRSEP
jgi:hypothetical protein